MLLLDNDDPRCKPLVDCNKDIEVALEYCPNYCGPPEEEICKTVDCTKPNAHTVCPRSCPEGGDTGEEEEIRNLYLDYSLI